MGQAAEVIVEELVLALVGLSGRGGCGRRLIFFYRGTRSDR